MRSGRANQPTRRTRREGSGSAGTGRAAASPPRKPAGVTYDIARQLASALPGVEEGTSYGTPSLKVRGKFMARLKEDGETMVIKVEMPLREALIRTEPGIFFITDHYRDYPAVLVRLASVDRKRLREILEHAWRFVAPPALRKSAVKSRHEVPRP